MAEFPATKIKNTRPGKKPVNLGDRRQMIG